MWLALLDDAGNILGKEDLIHTGWIVTARGFENNDIITVVVEREGNIARGSIQFNDGTLAAEVAIDPGDPLQKNEEVDFQAGALVIFGRKR